MRVSNIGKLFLQTIGLIVSLNSVSLLYGQQSNTQYQDFLNVTSASVILPISPQNNVGQSNHSVIAELRNAPAMTCSPGAFIAIALEGSGDNSTWTRIFLISSPTTLAEALPSNFKRSGVGAFPFLRINVLNFPNVNCIGNLHYVGTLYPDAIPNNPSAKTLSGFTVAKITKIGGGPTQLIGGSNATGSNVVRVVVYGLEFHATDTAASGVVTYTIGSVPFAGNCAASPITFDTIFLTIRIPDAKGFSSFVLPNSGIPYYTSSDITTAVNQICVDVSLTDATTMYGMTLIYRFE